MKKSLITIFTILLLILTACGNNTAPEEPTVEANTHVFNAIHNIKFSFNSFDEMNNLYEYCIKEEPYNYSYIAYNQLDEEIIARETLLITFYKITDGKWNYVRFINHCQYYDPKLGNDNAIISSGGSEYPCSMLIICVSFIYADTLGETLEFEHKKISAHGYNHEVNVYYNENLIMSIWYMTQLDIPIDYIESMITNGIREL